MRRRLNRAGGSGLTPSSRRGHPPRPCAVATAALIGAGIAASPAAAALPSAVSGLSCAPGTAVNQAFGSTEQSTARNEREPVSRALVGDSEIPAGQEPSTSSSFTATIPVYFHVLAKSEKR